MDCEETDSIDENKPNIIRKKSSFLRDGSYRIFHITKKTKEDSDDDDHRTNNNLDQTIHKKIDARNTKSLQKTNRNGLKQFFFPHKTSFESSLSIEVKTSPSLRHQTNEVSQSIVCHDTTSVNLLKKNKSHDKQENMADRAKANITSGTITRNNPFVHADKFESPGRKQVLINTHPEIQASFHRRRKRFIVACGTVIVALSVIITIIVYVVIMTVRFITETNRLAMFSHPRL